MGQPTPPGDIPLIEGLGSEWNEFVSAIPEEQRATLGPKLKERISSYETLKPWEDFHKSGVTPEHADTALRVLTYIENNPREIYDSLAKYLNITPAQAQEAVETEAEDAAEAGDSKRLAQLEHTIKTMTEIMLSERSQTAQEKQVQQQEEALEQEIAAVKKKYGMDIPEDQLTMRMYTKGISAEQAYQEYAGFVSEVQKRRPAPMVMSGSGGSIPARTIDPTKLDSKETKNLVKQMLDHANSETRN